LLFIQVLTPEDDQEELEAVMELMPSSGPAFASGLIHVEAQLQPNQTNRVSSNAGRLPGQHVASSDKSQDVTSNGHPNADVVGKGEDELAEGVKKVGKPSGDDLEDDFGDTLELLPENELEEEEEEEAVEEEAVAEEEAVEEANEEVLNNCADNHDDDDETELDVNNFGVAGLQRGAPGLKADIQSPVPGSSSSRVDHGPLPVAAFGTSDTGTTYSSQALGAGDEVDEGDIRNINEDGGTTLPGWGSDWEDSGVDTEDEVQEGSVEAGAYNAPAEVSKKQSRTGDMSNVVGMLKESSLTPNNHPSVWGKVKGKRMLLDSSTLNHAKNSKTEGASRVIQMKEVGQGVSEGGMMKSRTGRRNTKSAPATPASAADVAHPHTNETITRTGRISATAQKRGRTPAASQQVQQARRSISTAVGTKGLVASSGHKKKGRIDGMMD
jgi:hypothetical protein